MPKHSVFVALFGILLLASCKSIKPDRPPLPTLPGPPPALSSINIPIEIPLGEVEQRLNAMPKSKLFREQGLALGSGLTTDVDVDRNGPLKLQGLGEDRLQVRLPLKAAGSLRIEKKVLGQLLSTSIPFNESISPLFSFQPSISENWNFQISNLQIENWGRSLRYNLLGFEIDLEPIVKRQVQRVLENQMIASSLSQLDFKKTAQTSWDILSGTFQMEIEGMNGYLISRPETVRFKHEIGSDQILRLYIGMEGGVDGGIGSAPKVEKKPLPALIANGNRDNKLELMLPLSIPFSEVNEFLNERFSGQILKIDSKTTIQPSNIKTGQYGDKTLLSMDFKAVRNDKKEIQGQMYFAGKPEYDAASGTIQLAKPQFDVQSDDFFSNLAMRFKKGKIQRQIRKVGSFPIGDFLGEAPERLEESLKLDLEFGRIEITESSLDVSGIYQTETDLKVYLSGKGKVKVSLNR